MPHLLLRVLAVLAALALIACFFAALGALRLGFGADAPLPREAALGLLVPAVLGMGLFGLALWWLGRKLDRTARTEGRG